MTREEIEAIIRNGGSIMYRGRVISKLQDINEHIEAHDKIPNDGSLENSFARLRELEKAGNLSASAASEALENIGKHIELLKQQADEINQMAKNLEKGTPVQEWLKD